MAGSPPRILVVDDHRKIRDPLAVYLRRHGFDVVTVADAAGLWAQVERLSFDLVVLDVMLPDGDGFALCSQLFRRQRIPVILLTARAELDDRIRGLDMGADDYLVKPFEPRELLARIHSVLRRSAAQQTSPGEAATQPALRRYQFAGLVFVSGSGSLNTSGGQSTRLSTAEERLLQVFLDHPNQVLSRARLLDLTARADSDVFDRSIDRQVSRLRRKLTDCSSSDELLRTVWGGGYMLVADVIRLTP